MNAIPDLAEPVEIFIPQGLDPRDGKQPQAHPQVIHQQQRQPEGGSSETDENKNGRALIKD